MRAFVPVNAQESGSPEEGFFPTLGVGLLDFKLNSSPLAHPWSAQSQSVAGVPKFRVSVPNLRMSPECPALGVPNPRVSLPREGGDVRSKTNKLA